MWKYIKQFFKKIVSSEIFKKIMAGIVVVGFVIGSILLAVLKFLPNLLSSKAEKDFSKKVDIEKTQVEELDSDNKVVLEKTEETINENDSKLVDIKTDQEVREQEMKDLIKKT